MTTLKAGGLDFPDIGVKRYGHGRARDVAGGIVQTRKLVLDTRSKHTQLSQFAHAGKP
jgi:hypothetical protein